MQQTEIFTPFLLLMLLALAVWVYMYARRIPFIVGAKLSAEQLGPIEFARISPAKVSNPSDNLKNLFELPILFYALCIYLFEIGKVHHVYVTAAWVFVCFRILHSLVHCMVNIVTLRFWLYVASALVLWAMVLRAAIGTFL